MFTRSGTAEERLEEPELPDCARHDRLGPVATEAPPGYDGTMSWFKYSDAAEEWCDLTKVEARRRGPAVAALLSGRAEIFKERLDRDRLRDPETRVEYFLATLRPFFVKDLQSVFLYRFQTM